MKQNLNENQENSEKLSKIMDYFNTFQNLFKEDLLFKPTFIFFEKKIIPNFEIFSKQLKLQLLRVLTQISENIKSDDSKENISNIFNILDNYLPSPPSDSTQPLPIINFSYLELLLYIFHQFSQKAPGKLYSICGIKILTGQPEDIITNEDFTEKFNIFKNKLNYIQRQCNSFIKDFQLSLKTSSNSQQKNEFNEEEENQRKKIRMMRNISKMIQSLLTKQFISSKDIILSFKPNPKRKFENSPNSGDTNEQVVKRRRKNFGNFNRRSNNTGNFNRRSNNFNRRGGNFNGRNNFSGRNFPNTRRGFRKSW
jgi:hypothetical protein